MLGGGENHTFAFVDFALLSGSIDGEGGSDTLDYAAYDTAIWVTVAAASTNGYSGSEPATASFAGIDQIVAAGAADGDILSGANAASTWSPAASLSYAIDAAGSAIGFSVFDILQGGTAIDQFSLLVNNTVDLRGGAGADPLRRRQWRRPDRHRGWRSGQRHAQPQRLHDGPFGDVDEFQRQRLQRYGWRHVRLRRHRRCRRRQRRRAR